MITCPSIDQWHKDVPATCRTPIVIGLAVLIICLGGFGVWAALAPLDGAVVVSGSFVATGQNKTIQHLEGGIIKEVLVQEGQTVELNQPLLRLDETSAQAKLRRLVQKRLRFLVVRSRLEAEISGAERFELPNDPIFTSEHEEAGPIIERQRMELNARRAKLADEEKILRREIAGLQETAAGYAAQIKATRSRLGLFEEELKDKNTLLEKQLVRKTEVLALQRSEAGLSGELAGLQARAADAMERISRANQQIAQLRSASLQRSLEEMRSTETELDDLSEQIRMARDVLERAEIRAPVRGIIVRLYHHTRGGVVAPGSVIMELLPTNEELIIEARLNPHEIAHVRTGLDALVRLTALNQRLTPMIEGKVVYLSADAVAQADALRRLDDAPRRDTFVVRLRLDDEDVRHKLTHFRPTPGMPADVFIKTGERTFFQYIMKPVMDSFSRAFREQ